MDNFDGPAASPATGALGAGEEGFRVGCPSLHLIVQPQGSTAQIQYGTEVVLWRSGRCALVAAKAEISDVKIWC